MPYLDSDIKMESTLAETSGIADFFDDGDVEIGDGPSASNKVDVMTSKQFNWLSVVNIVLVAYTFLHVIFLYFTCNTIWFDPRPAKKVHGEDRYRDVCPPKMYLFTLLVVDIIG